MLNKIREELKSRANKQKAKILSGFFKTGKGQYGYGDKFLGVTVPESRIVAKQNLNLNLNEIKKLLYSEFHEERLVALLILVEKYRKEPKVEKSKIVKFYLANASKVNNWDLVDLTAHQILGDYILNHEPKLIKILYKLVRSGNLWERRIAIVSTFAFIRANKFKETFKIAELLMHDKHDLIHKAVGWMLREAGKRNQQELEKFLNKYYRKMPRTMLRYAIERLSDEKKKFYMRK